MCQIPVPDWTMRLVRILLQFDALNYTTVFIMFFSIIRGPHSEHYTIELQKQ